MNGDSPIIEQTEFDQGIVYLGDCKDILNVLGENIAEICVTSPPYNLIKDKPIRGTTKISKQALIQFAEWYPDEIEEATYQQQQSEIIKQLIRACTSSVFYNHKIRYAWHSRNKHKTQTKIYHPIEWINAPIWCEIIWNRLTPSRPSSRFNIIDERVFQIGKPLKWNNSLNLGNIWNIPPSRNKGHPCSYPIKLVENCILPTTDEGDIILDPYAGSGTTALAAIKHKRRFICIERDPLYYRLICTRINEALNQPSLF